MKTQDSEAEIDPFLCHCGPCRIFWREQFKDDEMLYKPPLDRSASTAVMYNNVRRKEDHPAVFKIGDRVLVRGSLTGVVKFVGTLDDSLLAPHCYVGVHLDEQINSPHNGVYKGKRYFHCPRGHGAFVHYQDVIRINPPEKRPPVSGNAMYPSHETLLKNRRERKEQDPTMDWGPNIRRQQPVVLCFDEHDMAIQDQRRADVKANRERRHNLASRGEAADDQRTHKDIQKWKSYFGGDERAEQMARTVKKLQIGYELGKEFREGGVGHERCDSTKKSKDMKRVHIKQC